MQFREQGKKIQCIRSTYDPASKRSHQKVVAAFDRYADKLPTVELAALTDTERHELVAWFDARLADKAARISRYRVMGAASSLLSIAESIGTSGDNLTKEQAELTWRALSIVGKALRKAGHPKPKIQRPSVEVSPQPDLPLEPVDNPPLV